MPLHWTTFCFPEVTEAPYFGEMFLHLDSDPGVKLAGPGQSCNMEEQWLQAQGENEQRPLNKYEWHTLCGSDEQIMIAARVFFVCLGGTLMPQIPTAHQ